MAEPDYRVEIAIDSADQLIAIKPPVDSLFREQVYAILDGMQLMQEIVVRGGNFFETKHLPDGSPYSELRIASTALSVTGQRLINIAHESAEVLRSQNNTITGQNNTVTVSPHWVTPGGSRKLFDDRG